MPKELTAFRIAPDTMAALRAIKAQEGLPIAVQVDFALRDWLKRKGVKLAAKPAPGRKRAGGGRA